MTRALVVRGITGLMTLLLCAAASDAAAQEAPGFRPKQLTVAAGMLVARGYPVGDVTATLRRNATGAPPPFTLLRAESELERAIGVDARVALALTRALAVEVGGLYSKPNLGVTVSQDPEAAAGAVVSERVSQYAIDVSGIYHLPLSLGRRMRAYAIGGGGYLRQLHEGQLLVETGHTIHAGGGVQFWLRGAGGEGRSLGARAEARYVRRNGGIDFEDRARSFPTVSVLFFFGL